MIDTELVMLYVQKNSYGGNATAAAYYVQVCCKFYQS